MIFPFLYPKTDPILSESFFIVTVLSTCVFKTTFPFNYLNSSSVGKVRRRGLHKQKRFDRDGVVQLCGVFTENERMKMCI